MRSTCADGYKYTHGDMYPDDLEYMHAYAFARHADVLLFGLTHFLSNMYPMGDPVENYTWMGSFPQRWKALQDLGYLPLEITAAPEGTWVKAGDPLFTVTNTDPRFAWLVTWIETYLLKVWYPSTIATRQRHLYRELERRWMGTSGSMELLPFAVHDFGYRGATSEESACLAGAAHLLTFKGTDTLGGSMLLRAEYNVQRGETIPASEHSVMMMGTDAEMIERILDVTPEHLPVSIVLDTYNYINAVHTLCTTFKDRIAARTAPVIIRPDSGDPDVLIPWTLGSIIGAFGYDTNDYNLLVPRSAKMIWGDGIDHEKILELTDLVIGMGIDPSAVVYGMGGNLHNGVSRDTFGFSYKVSQIARSGKIIDVHKDAPGKQTRSGRQQVANGEVVYKNGVLRTCSTLVTL